MLSSSPWPAAIARFVAGTAVVALVGLLVGQPLLVLLMAALGALGFHGYQLYRLESWLRRSRRTSPPKATGLWGEVFDIMVRRQQRQRHRRHRLSGLLQRFRESANAMPDGTVVLDGNGAIQWWNRVATHYLALDWPRDQGVRIANLIRHPEFTGYLNRADWNEAVKIPAPRNAWRMLEIRVVPYGLDQQLLLARDVTQVHRLETMRQDFVANISHEFRTPLTVLRGMTEQIADHEVGDDKPLGRSLTLMEEQIERMSLLVDDLLLLSRLETEAPAVEAMAVDMPSIVESAVEEARRFSSDQHELSTAVDPDLTVRGDADEIRSALSNLLTNAVKYTEPGGRITVDWHQEGSEACLSVSDTGRGIPPQHLPRLTERFYRVDPGGSGRAAGTGLGLAIVKHALSRHGATLDIESSPGEGSRFCCRFPEPVRGFAGADNGTIATRVS